MDYIFLENSSVSRRFKKEHALNTETLGKFFYCCIPWQKFSDRFKMFVSVELQIYCMSHPATNCQYFGGSQPDFSTKHSLAIYCRVIFIPFMEACCHCESYPA